MSCLRATVSLFLCFVLTIFGQQPTQNESPNIVTTTQKYKLTIVESASTSKRTKKGRVSSQAVVKVTDENDAPVAGIAVTFAIPQLTVGGAAFANGAATAVVATNAAGLASSGSFAVTAGTSFSMSVTA